MMHVDGMHRVLKVFAFSDINDFLTSVDIPDEPCYIVLPNPDMPTVQLHGYHVLTEDDKPCVLDSNVLVYHSLSELLNDEAECSFCPYGELTTVYVTSENQIYQKLNDTWTKGFIIFVNGEITVFADYIPCEIKVYDTVETFISHKFDTVNFETLTGTMKPNLVPEVCYIKETEILCCHIDSEKINVIARDVGYQSNDKDFPFSPRHKIWVSKARHLFKGKCKVTNFDFVYNDCNVQILLQW